MHERSIKYDAAYGIVLKYIAYMGLDYSIVMLSTLYPRCKLHEIWKLEI